MSFGSVVVARPPEPIVSVRLTYVLPPALTSTRTLPVTGTTGLAIIFRLTLAWDFAVILDGDSETDTFDAALITVSVTASSEARYSVSPS